MRLAAGEDYESPWVYGSHGDGLDELSGRFHEHLRARPHHRPARARHPQHVGGRVLRPRPRPVAGARGRRGGVGVERFVLDDGWFRHRRDDTAGLGDWFVDDEVWPDGLGPIVDHVRGLGLEFGLWVEPEMVNPDSDLARAHPEWVLRTGDRLPPEARQQQVLDLGQQGRSPTCSSGSTRC
ncbi:alpha-galactosidase [Oerskovia sp. M15]